MPVDLNLPFSGSDLGLDTLRTRQGLQCKFISLHVSRLPQASPVDPTGNFSFRVLTFLQVIPIDLNFTICYLFSFFFFASSSSPVKREQQPLTHSLTVRIKLGHLGAALSRILTVKQQPSPAAPAFPFFLLKHFSSSSFRTMGDGSQMSYFHINNGLSRHFLREQGRLFCLVTSNVEKTGVNVIPALFQ